MDIKLLNTILQKSFPYSYVYASDTIAATVKIDENTVFTTFYVGASSIQISFDGGDTEWNDLELEHFIDQYNSLFASQTGFIANQRYDLGKDSPQIMFDCKLTKTGLDEYDIASQIYNAFRKLKGSGRALAYLSTFLTYVRNK